MPKAAHRRQHWLPKLDHNSLLNAERPTARVDRSENEIVVYSETAEVDMTIVVTSPLRSLTTGQFSKSEMA
jgi:hypothetical protein